MLPSTCTVRTLPCRPLKRVWWCMAVLRWRQWFQGAGLVPHPAVMLSSHSTAKCPHLSQHPALSQMVHTCAAGACSDCALVHAGVRFWIDIQHRAQRAQQLLQKFAIA